MCAIIGLASKKQGFNGKLLRLLDESKIRGLHAFGISYFSDGKLHYSKHLRLIELKQKITTLQADKVLIHCRYSTSGDFQVLENNQPIISKNSALIFNGIISMGTKVENEHLYGEKYQTDNDGEIVSKMAEKGENYLGFISTVGSFAGGILHDNGVMKMFRNQHRPMHWVADEFGTWYASTKDIFKRAGFGQSTECLSLENHVHD